MSQRSIPERVRNVERRLIPAACVLFFATGLWLGASISLLALVVLGTLAGCAVRPLALSVVQRRLSVWALLGDDDTPEHVALPSMPQWMQERDKALEDGRA